MISDYYFQSYADYFWQWEDNLDVLTIPNGNTIAYSAYVLEVMEKLGTQGLPPFGSLLLAIIATNPNSKDSINQVYGYLYSEHPPVVLSEGTDFLYTLHDLPSKYKQGKNRLLLFQTIFKNCHNINSPHHSERILVSHELERKGLNSFSIDKPFNENILIKDYRTLSLLNRKYPDTYSIINAIANIPEFEEEIKIEVSPILEKEGKKDFVDELIENDKTFYVGSLIKRIWGGLNIPVHSALPSQQPLGGISDLTNKGDFDKLLISEFANDDLVFLSRLANNEALYIQREIPPINSNLERIILIDISLKNWGTPKSIAFAILLAIAKHPKTNIACTAYVVGNSYRAISFDNIHEIIENLDYLDGNLGSVCFVFSAASVRVEQGL